MIVRRFSVPLILLLLLAACGEETTQQSTSVSADTSSLSTDANTTPSDTAGVAGGMNAGSTTPGNNGMGSGTNEPASVPQGQYTTTASGLKYYDVQQGNGASPTGPTDTVRVHYAGWVQSSGEKFDSSYDRGQPASFRLDRVIRGWTEGLQSMQVGGKRQLVIPANLAYGQRPPPGSPIQPGSTLVFDVELLGVASQSGNAGQSSAGQ